MEENKSILHELYVFSEWKPEPEYIQKPDNILPENISALWKWFKFFGPKKSLIDNVSAIKERKQKWQIALGDEGKVIAVLADTILEIRTKRSDYATIAARTTVSRDAYPQWRKLVWSPDCSFLALAYGNGVVSFFDLTASNLFNIPIDCTRPGGLECTDNTHAVADIIFMPLRVKDNKWNWEVVIATYEGKLRGFLVSQTEGYTLHHKFRFPAGVAALAYCDPTLYVAGLPRPHKDPSSPVSAGITAWRIVNDEPFYKLSVVSDELEAQIANERFHIYVPFLSSKHLAFIVHMALSPDGGKLVCLHCNGDISVWRLPILKLLYRWALAMQPEHDLQNPLAKDDKQVKKDAMTYYAADVNWWSNEEIIVSRFNGAVSICNVSDMINILGTKPEFFQGSPQVTCAHNGAFMVLECESNVVPANKSRSDESMELVKVESDGDESMMEMGKELVKWMLYTITDMETFQPKPRRITVVSRVYRLLGVRSTTPTELFSRKIESGQYSEALSLAETFGLDNDLVYQQQWRKNVVSTDAIHNYLSKVSKKIWVVHQCVDRLPETLSAAEELLNFGLHLTNHEILQEINKDRSEDIIEDPEEITLKDLNAYSTELLRCRHVMLFYAERLILYEAILKCEKSAYVKDEYDRLRSHSIAHSSMELAKESRIQALTCLWLQINTTALHLAILDNLPETTHAIYYQHLLPIKHEQWFDQEPIELLNPFKHINDWCRKEIFRSIWSSNWSEDASPEVEVASYMSSEPTIAKWFERRAREIEERSGLVSHAFSLVTIAMVAGEVEGLEKIMFHLIILDTLVYEINMEDITLKDLEDMSLLEICALLMKNSTPATFVRDLRHYVVPSLKRYEMLFNRVGTCIMGLTEYLESVSVNDLSTILLVLQSPKEFELDLRTHLDLVERCLFAHTGTHQLDKACDLLDTILKESDGSISTVELVRRVRDLERLVSGSELAARRGVPVAVCDLRDLMEEEARAKYLLNRIARNISKLDEKPTQQDWEKLLKDILELQSNLLQCVRKEECYEIYASSLLTSGDAASIRLSSEVLTCSAQARRSPHLVTYARSVELVSAAAKEYFNSASSLTDPALELARCCLTLIKDDNPEVQQELDLIAALPILNAFNLTILPIQVRLCEDRITLIEDCLQLDSNAYLASHKLLKLAKLLRISGDDEQTREGVVLQLVCSRALSAGVPGRGAAVSAARRLAALRHAPAAELLAQVARDAHAHADTDERKQLYAASLAYCMPNQIEDVLRARLSLELEGLQQMGAALKEHTHISDRCSSVDDEFSDAITTPVIEKKDLVAPQQKENKIPLFNYLLDTFQSKLSSNENKSATSESIDRSVHCQEFYSTLYPEHKVSNSYYRYDRFSIPDNMDSDRAFGHSMLNWFYVQNCLEDGVTCELETEVVQKCAEELLYRDTALSVSCLLRSADECSQTRKLIESHHSRPAVSAALYATLVRCNAPELRLNVYLTEPVKMARRTLKNKNTTEEQMEVIRQCIDKLTGMGEVDRLRQMGFNINGLLFNADEDYRKEMIYRVARSPNKDHLQMACEMARKYGVDPLEAWVQHAVCDPGLVRLSPDTLPNRSPHAYKRIQEDIWPVVRGVDHVALINYFTLLKCIDEKPLIFGLTATEHIKLLKKAKAASTDLDYKLLLEQPTAEQLTCHIVKIARPENMGMVGKFLRTLPPALRLPISVNALYTAWLTEYFFSVGESNANNKKWMHQYRECASYFTKLAKDDLLRFLENTCFSQRAVTRVPAGTRNLMLMQAVDYCQQEQENDYKFLKEEMSWAQVGQELTRWARFLENYHSSTVQAVRDACALPKDQIWPELEKSHGNTDQVLSCMSELVAAADLRPSQMSTLLHCLCDELTCEKVMRHLLDTRVNTTQQVQALVTRLSQYHKEGVKFSDEFLELVMEKATELGLPPHKQISLLSLNQKTQIHDTGDMTKVAKFTLDLLQTEWPDLEYAKNLTEDRLLCEEGRRETYDCLVKVADTWSRRKALVDVLACWPTTTQLSGVSLHCEYVATLLSSSAEHRDSLALIKLLLNRPLLTYQELKYLSERATDASVMNALWAVVLNKCEQYDDVILEIVNKHKESFQKQEIEDDLVKELLDSDLFIKLVPTPLFSAIINYIMNRESNDEAYTLQWAIDELVKAKYLAEAGHLQLMTIGVPSALRGFSQTILYYKNIFSKNNN